MDDSGAPIIMGCDHAAYDLKENLKAFIIQKGIEIRDVGAHSAESVDYPDFGCLVAGAVSAREYSRGILLCGTGLGMSMVANKFQHVRAALCNDLFSAIMCRRHNDANILVLPGRLIGVDEALRIVRTWLETPFEGGRHQRRLDKIAALESRLRK